MTNTNCPRNYRLVKWNGNYVEEGIKEIRSIKTCLSACGPESNCTSKTQFEKRVGTIYNLLQSRCFRGRFCSKMIGHPIFKSSLANGMFFINECTCRCWRFLFKQ